MFCGDPRIKKDCSPYYTNIHCGDCYYHRKLSHNACCGQNKFCNPKITKGLIQSLKDKIINLQNESKHFKFAKRPIKKKQKDYYYLMLRKLNGLDKKIENLESLFITHLDSHSDDVTNSRCDAHSWEYFAFYDSVRSLIDLANQLKEDLAYEKENFQCNNEYTSQLCNHIKILELEISNLSCYLEKLQNSEVNVEEPNFSMINKDQCFINKACKPDYSDYLCGSDNKCSLNTQFIKNSNCRPRKNTQFYARESFHYPGPVKNYYNCNNGTSSKKYNVFQNQHNTRRNNGYGVNNFGRHFNNMIESNDSRSSICSCNMCNKNNKFEARNNCFNNITYAPANSCCSINSGQNDNNWYRNFEYQNNCKNVHYTNYSKPQHAEFINVQYNRNRGRTEKKRPLIDQYNYKDKFIYERNMFSSHEDILVSDYKSKTGNSVKRNSYQNEVLSVSDLSSTDGIILKHVLKRNKKRKLKSPKLQKNNDFHQQNNAHSNSNGRVFKNVVYYELPRTSKRKNNRKSKQDFNTPANNVSSNQNWGKREKRVQNKDSQIKKVKTINYTLEEIKPKTKSLYNQHENTESLINNISSESDDTDNLNENKNIKNDWKNYENYLTKLRPNELQRQKQTEFSTISGNNWKYTHSKHAYAKKYMSHLNSDEKASLFVKGKKKYHKGSLVDESDSYETIYSGEENGANNSFSGLKNRKNPEELIIFLKNNEMSSALKQSDLGKIIDTLSDFKKDYCENCIVQERKIQLCAEKLNPFNDNGNTKIIVKKEIIKCSQCKRKLEDKLFKTPNEEPIGNVKNQHEYETFDKVIDSEISQVIEKTNKQNKTELVNEEHKLSTIKSRTVAYGSSANKKDSAAWNKNTTFPTYYTTVNQAKSFLPTNVSDDKSKISPDLTSFGNTININIDRMSIPVKESQDLPNNHQDLLGDINNNSKIVHTSQINQTTPVTDNIEFTGNKNKVVQEPNPSLKISKNEMVKDDEREINNILLSALSKQVYNNKNDSKSNNKNSVFKTPNIDNKIPSKAFIIQREQIYNMDNENENKNVFNLKTDDIVRSNMIPIKKKQLVSNKEIIEVPAKKGNTFLDYQYSNKYGPRKLVENNKCYEYTNSNRNEEVNYLPIKPLKKNKIHFENDMSPNASRSFVSKLLHDKHYLSQRDDYKFKTSTVFNIYRKNSIPFKRRLKGQSRSHCNNIQSLRVIKKPNTKDSFSSNCYNSIVRLTMTSESSLGVLDWIKIARELKNDRGYLISNCSNY